MSSAGVFKGGANGPEEEEEEELSALMQRIKAAKPPAEVLKVNQNFCQLLQPHSVGKVTSSLRSAQRPWLPIHCCLSWGADIQQHVKIKDIPEQAVPLPLHDIRLGCH